METTCTQQQFETHIPATLEQIDRVCGDVRGFLARKDLEQYFFELSLVIREALINAVTHGCGLDAEKNVRISLAIDGSEMVVEIEDPGPGFDWENQMNQDATIADVHGRGLLILQVYCNRFEYNVKGNQVRLYKSLTH
ncbi:ATP-binding protein [Planctomycetota bacterium]